MNASAGSGLRGFQAKMPVLELLTMNLKNETIVRGLQSTNDLKEFETSAKIAQIMSSIFFAGCVAYLAFSNGTRLAIIQQASQEKRLAVCAYLTTGVAAVSCFLNLFQITDIDNLVLPKTSDSYTVDLCRPVEWILTCPVLQLVLVIMGGPKIPDYRRVLMPSFAAVTMIFGVISLFLDEPETFFCYAAGTVVFVIMLYFNRLQILEFSDNEEGLLTGYSEFRKATIILIASWFPFPGWYMLSPEGLGIIDNVLIIQMGWMLLNITAKGSFILYIQKAKERYDARMKISKVMKGVARPEGGYAVDGDDEFEDAFAGAQLRPCVTETMGYLGMMDKSERFLRLLKDAKITNLDQLEHLTERDCEEKRLPFGLIMALQQRHRIYKFEVHDDVEEGIVKGESHYSAQKGNMHKSVEDGAAELPAHSDGFNKAPPPPPRAMGMDARNMSGMDPMSMGPGAFQFEGVQNDRMMFAFDGMPGQRTPMGSQMGKMNNPMNSFGFQGDARYQAMPVDSMANHEVLERMSMIEEHLRVLSRLDEKIETGLDKMDTGFAKTLSASAGLAEKMEGLEQKVPTPEEASNLKEQQESSLQGVLRDVEKQSVACKAAVDYGLQNISRSYEKFDRFEAILLEKFEFVSNVNDKRQKQTQEDIQDLNQTMRKFANQASDLNQSNQATISSFSSAVEDLGVKNQAILAEVLVKNQTALTSVSNSMEEVLRKSEAGMAKVGTEVSNSLEQALANVSAEISNSVAGALAKSEAAMAKANAEVTTSIDETLVRSNATLVKVCDKVEQVANKNLETLQAVSNSVEDAWIKNQTSLSTLSHAVEESWNRNQATLTTISHAVEDLDQKSKSHMSTIGQVVDKNQATLSFLGNSVEKCHSSLSTLGQSVERNQGMISSTCQSIEKNQVMLSTVSQSVEKNQGMIASQTLSMDKNQSTLSHLGLSLEKYQAVVSTLSQKLDEGWAKNLVVLTQKLDEGWAKNQATFKGLSHTVEEALLKSRTMVPSYPASPEMSGLQAMPQRDLDKFISSWAEQIMAEARSNTCSIQSKMASMEEAHLKTRFELETQLVNKFEESLKSSTNVCITKISNDFSQEFRRSEEVQSQSLRRVSQDMSNVVEKHVQIGTGIVTNAVKALSDTLHDGQGKVEGKISTQLDAAVSKIFYQTEQSVQSYASAVKAEIRDHKTLTNSALEQASAAKERSRDCGEMINSLADRLFHGATQEQSPVILQRRPSSAVNRRRNMIMLS